PRLIFEKNISMHKKDLLHYEVRENEHLYQIMRGFGLTNTQISKSIPEIKKLNPDIEDLSDLRPGQTLILPVLKSSDKAIGREMDRWKAKEVRTKVRAGESLVSMLRRIGKVPHYLIFNEYLNLFRDLNPDIDNINRLKPGQHVSLPVYTGSDSESNPGLKGKGPAEKKEKTAAGNNALQEETGSDAPVKNDSKPKKDIGTFSETDSDEEIQDKKVQSVNPLKEKCMSALDSLGLDLLPGESMFIPKADGSWLRIDLQATPVFESYAGNKILLAEKRYVQKWNKELANSGVTVCPAFNWDEKKVLKWIARHSEKDILIWEHERPFVVSMQDFSLEFKADLIAKVSGRGLHVINFISNHEPATGDIAQNLLQSIGIDYSEFRISDSGRAVLTFEALALSSIYVPDECRGFKIVRSAQSESEKSFAGENLHEKKMELKMLDDAGHKITMFLSLPAAPDGRLILSGKTANPYFFALLNMHGHDCVIAE
ncbi:MAG: LysM peptidoglycan-binding domain-containing protein, partial [Desulfovibrionales bacterium]